MSVTVGTFVGFSNKLMYYRLNEVRHFAKLCRWVADTRLAHEMQQLKHFDDIISFCLDKKDELTRRDIIASLSYIGTSKGKDFKTVKFKSYMDSIMSRADVLFSDKNIYLLVHRLAVLGYTPGLCLLYKNYISKLRFEEMDTKGIAIICWGYMKNELSFSWLFESISKILINKIKLCNLTDISLLLWSYCRFIPLQHRLILLLKTRLFDILNAIQERLMGFLDDTVKYTPGQFIASSKPGGEDTCDLTEVTDKSKEVSALADLYVDPNGQLYSNIAHDLSMSAKSLSLVSGSDDRVLKLVDFTLFLSEIGKVDLTAQCLTSLWEAMAKRGLKEDKLLYRLCELSRYLRLDHTFNSNMLVKIMESNTKLGIKDPRIIYQCIHWLDNRANQMHANHIHSIAKSLVYMGIDNEKAWKRLGVAIQSRGVELSAGELEEMVELFRKIGRGNDRIYGVLNHFIAVKNDHATYGPT